MDGKKEITMEKTVIYTQRVEVVESYNERRDCADQRIPEFVRACGYLPVPLPNISDNPEEYVKLLAPAGIILTGGNSLTRYGGTAPERDGTDKKLIEAALRRGIPLYGFCRGMQSVLDYFGCELVNIKGHAAVRHEAAGRIGTRIVNSYHNQACLKLKEPLEVMAVSGDGVIEAAAYPEKHIFLSMWHPERENPFCSEDMELVKKLFG